MLISVRLHAQQLCRPRLERPADVARFMGAVQAQDMAMSRWALGLRTRRPALSAVEKDAADGKIIRMHLLRPTWHWVAAENVRWMLALSGARIKKGWLGFARASDPDMTEVLCARCNKALEKILRGRALNTEELSAELAQNGIPNDLRRTRRLLVCAEADGIVCGGPSRGKKHTFMLLEERIAPARPLPKAEALARLARLYFQSHSPASPEDFAWWGGLSMGEARCGMDALGRELSLEDFEGGKKWVHASCVPSRAVSSCVELLPAFDEYLIGYKDRSAVLDPSCYDRAFNRCGTFYPVVLSGGKIVGNWSKKTARKTPAVDISLFASSPAADPVLLAAAQKKYLQFLAR